MNVTRRDSALGVRSGGGWLFAPLLGVLVLVVLLIMGMTQDTAVTGTAMAGPKRPVPPAPIDRNTEPCALLENVGLDDLGVTRIERELGGYGTCAMSLFTTDGSQAAIEVSLAAPGEYSVSAPAERNGSINVFRPVTDGPCFRVLTRAPGTPSNSPGVWIRVGQQGFAPKDGAPLDVCGIGDDVAAQVVRTLGDDLARIPPRVADPSVTTVDACSLLTEDDFAGVPELDASQSYAGFANWSCVWGSNAEVEVYYGRNPPPRDAAKSNNAANKATTSTLEDYCRATLDRGEFTATDGGARVESVIIQVHADGMSTKGMSMKRACSIARKLTTPVSHRLPPV